MDTMDVAGRNIRAACLPIPRSDFGRPRRTNSGGPGVPRTASASACINDDDRWPQQFLAASPAHASSFKMPAAFWRRNLGHTSAAKGTVGISVKIRSSESPIGK